ncbi:MAG: peptidylprolyl isomerase [Syntrophaceae bacterium]
MKQVIIGNTVKVHYKGLFDDGTVFDSSHDGDPLEFTIGGKQVIPGFEDTVIGMSIGETKTSRITSDQAYGPRRSEMVVVIDRNQLPANLEPTIGQVLRFRQNDGGFIEVTVIDVSDSSVTFDGNHPLAGKDLIFEIQLMEIN